MLNSFYLFLIPFLVAAFYLSIRYFINRKKIEKIVTSAFLDADVNNNIDEAKEKVFAFYDSTKGNFTKSMLAIFHWLLHFIVLFLKFISDATDVLYSTVRDFFLKTAVKEKDTVSTFWKHLKEYKKEKEEEEENK